VIIRKGAAEISRIARAGDLVGRTISHVGERIRRAAEHERKLGDDAVLARRSLP